MADTNAKEVEVTLIEDTAVAGEDKKKGEKITITESQADVYREHGFIK